MKIYFFIFFNTVFSCFSQNSKTFTVKSVKDGSSIENVICYVDNVSVFESSSDGLITISKTKNNIKLYKIGYKDLILEYNKVDNEVFLIENDVIEIEDVVVKKISDEEILNNVLSSFKSNKSKYKLPKYFHFFNSLTNNNKKLHYLNTLAEKTNIEEMNINGMKIENFKGLIKNFSCIKENEYFNIFYDLNNKKINFPYLLTLPYYVINSKNEIDNLIEKRKKYDFKIISDDEFYKIAFKPKNSEKFTYEGFMIVNKIDYAITEINFDLIKSKSNKMVRYLYGRKKDDVKQEYEYLKESFSMKLIKEDNVYRFLNSNYQLKLKQLKGNFVNQVFENNINIEAVEPFELKNYKFLDIFNFALK